jgi:light-regulated signal transduction histidine kinase (bacteriophytochrome)
MEMVLHDVTDDLSRAITESSAQITHDVLPTFTASRIQMRQLMQNLLANAIKFRKPGTALTIHISARENTDHWLFSLCDNGIGMDPAFKERIFKIFQRLHTREEYSGTGVGLAICNRVVERRGGKIWVETQIDEGSTFYFTIPKEIEVKRIFKA